MSSSVLRNATCIGCGCVCDDIDLHTEGGRIVRADRACELGRSWFAQQGAEPPGSAALIHGRPAPLEDAITAAAEILGNAAWPLVYGLGNSTVQAQRRAVELAETIGGVIDSHTSSTHGPSKIGSQLVGKVAATLGEVRNRADLIIYWGTNPEESHPRHFSRYTLDPVGKFTPGGRADRTMILIDVRETPSSRPADQFLQLRPGTDFEVLTALRALLRGRPVDEARVAASGLTVAQLGGLLEQMKQARYGAIFFGSGLTTTRGKHLNAAAVLALTAELNAFTKFVAIPMRDHGNEAGADHVLCWTTGYPFGVDLSRGYPRSNPGEFTAADVLVRGEVDAALVVGHGQWAPLPQPALDHLARIPTVVLDSRVRALSRTARVHISVGVPGISVGGMVYRMDKVPLPVRAAVESPFPSEEDVLDRILAEVAHAPRG
jgi:formylmethanofuran dehydrogenase subunit B